MPRRTDTTIVAVKLRIREGLRKKLLREAEKAGRSLNQELERRLVRSFELEAMLLLAQCQVQDLRLKQDVMKMLEEIKKQLAPPGITGR